MLKHVLCISVKYWKLTQAPETQQYGLQLNAIRKGCSLFKNFVRLQKGNSRLHTMRPFLANHWPGVREEVSILPNFRTQHTDSINQIDVVWELIFPTPIYLEDWLKSKSWIIAILMS